MFFHAEINKRMQFSLTENQLLRLGVSMVFVRKGTRIYQFLSAISNVSYRSEYFDKTYKSSSGRARLVKTCTIYHLDVCSMLPELG